MKISKTLCGVLAGVLIALLAISGCGQTPAPDNSQPAANSQPAIENTSAMEGNMYLTDLPIVKEKETFTIFCDDSGMPEDKIMYPILEEQTNVHVELMLMPYEAAKEKLNILLNSGDYPDVIGGWLLGDNEVMSEGMSEKMYIPLEKLIEKYSPTMTDILNIEGVRQTMTLPDGHIYSIPYVIGEPTVSFLPFINTAWLDKLGLKLPTTTEELRTVLRAFKEKDPAGNGNTIPFSGDPNNLSLGTFAGWWGVDASQSGTNRFFAFVDGKVVFGPAQDGYKEMIKYFAELYAEGLVDPELYTQDLATWKAKGKKGMYGVSMAYGAGDFAERDAELYPQYERTQYDPLPVLQAKSDVKPLWRRNGYGVTTFRTQVVITDKAKNPATIIRWWDNVFQLENSVQIQAGLIGKRILKTGEGQYQAIPDAEISDDDKEVYGWGNMFTQSLPKYIPVGFRVKDIVEVYREKDVCDALYEPFLNAPMPVAWVKAEDADRLKILETDILNYMRKAEAAWVSGQVDVEADWANHLKQLDSIGLPELTQLRQAAIDGN